MKFNLGRVVITPGATGLIAGLGQTPIHYIHRHLNGDWGDLDEHDIKMNNEALSLGNRILSSYSLPMNKKVWVITESDRSVTTILLPEEY